MQPNPIVKVTVENFQSHKKSEFAPAANGQLTVLTGPSDCGKSALLVRALRWLLYNIPQGIDFIRSGSSFARVTVEYKNGFKVIREKRRSNFNRYKVITPDGSAQTYEGFGSNVPLEVQQVTGVYPVIIAGINFNLNIAEQLDGPFLGRSVSAGARAKVLGKLAGTEEVDYASKQLSTDLYRQRQKANNLADDLEGLEKQIDSYSYLEGMEKVISQVSTGLEKLKEDMALVEKLKYLQGEIESARRKANDEAFIAAGLGTKLNEIQPTLKRLETDIPLKEKLFSISNELDNTRRWIERQQQLIQATQSVDEVNDLINQSEKNTADKSLLTEMHEQFNAVDSARKLALNMLLSTEFAEITNERIKETEFLIESQSQFKNLNYELVQTSRQVSESEKLLSQVKMLPEITMLINLVEHDNLKLESLQPLKEQLDSNLINLARTDKNIQQLKYLENLIALVSQTEESINTLSTLFGYASEATKVAGYIESTESMITDLNTQAEKAQRKYIDLLTGLGICPTCGSQVREERLREVV